MKLYRVPHATPEWVGTQDEARHECRERGLKFDASTMQVEVPTDKPGLLSWLNERTITEGHAEDASPGEEHDFLAAAEQRAVRASEPDTRPLGDDGHPEVRTAFTVAQVAASALPRDVGVQDICHAVSKLRAGELGYVALEVMARAAKLGGVPGVGNAETQG